MQFRKISLFTIVAVTLSTGVTPADAQKAGENISKDTGVVSNMTGDTPSVKYVTIQPPTLGVDYEVKVNFLKVETSAAVVDDFIDEYNRQARAEGKEQGSAVWDALREEMKSADSKADFEVFDAAGKSIGKASDLGAFTLFKTVKFKARTSTYSVKIRCTSGAGLYHLTFEYD